MNIRYIALMLMLLLSTSMQAEEFAAQDGVSPSGGRAESTTQEVEPLSEDGYPLNWREMDGDQRRSWLEKKNKENDNKYESYRKEIVEKNRRDYQIYEQKEVANEKARQASKPKCTNIKFTGVATPPPYGYVIAEVLASRDIEDTLARNPIQCSPNQFRNSVCTGVAYFRNHKGRIVDWSRDFYVIDTLLDFDTGRRNIELSIRRKDAVCIK